MITEKDVKDNCIAFSMWEQGLAKNGYPRTDKGQMMNVYQLYDYWHTNVNKQPFLVHARMN